MKTIIFKTKMNSSQSNLTNFEENFQYYPFFFLFNLGAIGVSFVIRWALRSCYSNLPDINKNINTFINIYIIEFLNAAICILVYISWYSDNQKTVEEEDLSAFYIVTKQIALLVSY